VARGKRRVLLWARSRQGGRIALDVEYKVYVNGFRFASLIASPGLEEELARGFMASNCISPRLVKRVRKVGSSLFILLDPEGGGGKACRRSGGGSDKGLVEKAAMLLDDYASRVRRLGLAVHTAVLLHDGGAICIYDVSRHSAVYKAVGAAARRGLRGRVLAVTGRPSGGMVRAAALIGASAIVSPRRPLMSSLVEAGVLGVDIYSSYGGGLRLYRPLYSPGAPAEEE